ncbi:hypothetical protein BGZ76_002792 [Entomortierella beljakovae]|nr:hypothetical protein BGZ76_002792 [Entomortierella beljakovae]
MDTPLQYTQIMEESSTVQSSATTSPITIPSGRSQRHQPVKIHTMNSSSYSSLNLSRSPPSGSFLHSPPPLTAPVHSNSFNQLNIVGRSRSSSRSGGVVFKTRPRADSEAARSAMEAMVQSRLDQITKRLSNFNAQSHELHEKTDQLAKVFHDKAKRLYLVEDHLLKLQGKPGLSEEFLEKGPRPRRLTNDLEELRMGVKTLRRKFQAAGSVVSTVGWWKQLKEARDQWQPIDAYPPSTAPEPQDDYKNDLAQDQSHSKESSTNQSLSLQTMFTRPDTIGDVAQPDTFSTDTKQLVSSSKDEEIQTLGLRSPPLTPKAGQSLLIKGLEERLYTRGRPLSIIPDLEEPHLLSSLLSPTEGMEQSEQQDVVNNDTDGEPQSRLKTKLTPPSPASPTSEATESIISSRNAGLEYAQHEPKTNNNDDEKAQVQNEQLVENRSISALQVQPNFNCEPKLDIPAQEQQEIADGEEQHTSDNWVQALWRLLIRAEYIFLGTAVLGAMMPDNWVALCAGFFSALMYGVLLIHYRLTAPQGMEAPQPPTGANKPIVHTQNLDNEVTVTNHTSSSIRQRRSMHSPLEI